ncbi:ATP-dependent DNA ligase LigA [Halobium salinum]|uniref:DNA ligase n=1 Tax=Halobium salinum TaxID=1364940 RepID=A0ABD5P745_9EURY|nr:ATP-dependent DNA ligase LigA [Halobium salinum]
MEFAEFAARAREMEAESADIATTLLVRDLFLAAEGTESAPGAGESDEVDDADGLTDTGADGADELPILARFVQGRVFPAWRSATLDIGPSLCYEALARAAGTNVSPADVEARLAEVGEIGAVAAGYEFGGQQGLGAFGAGGDDGLTVREVDRTLRDLAAAEGAGSEGRKVDALFGLFNRTSPDEARFLARLVLAEMRIGVGEGTVRDAVAEAFLVEQGNGDDEADGTGEADDTDVADGDDEGGSDSDTDDEGDSAGDDADEAGADDPTLSASDEVVAAVERALQVSNDYGMVAVVARDEGLAGLADVRLDVGRPVQAMLAQAGTVTDALGEWGVAAVETKYDGARVQVHYDGASASLYSRNMEDVTDPLPEIREFVEAELDAPAILDGEVVAVDDTGTPQPFQEVLRRFRRKHDVGRMREAVELRLHAFDCLHADGDDLLEAPLTERHDRLRRLLPEAATSDLLVSDDPDAVADFEADALEAGHEGIMLKDPEATYSPGKRGKHWLKRKPDVETLDLVVTGAEWGEGRRAQFLGTFLLSARVEDGDGDAGADTTGDAGADTADNVGYETIGKVATGITDEELAALSELLEPHVVSSEGREVDLRPEVVFEVGYEEIQRSPTYSSGYALRFPRFVSVRDDKDPADADSLSRVERLAESQ